MCYLCNSHRVEAALLADDPTAPVSAVVSEKPIVGQFVTSGGKWGSSGTSGTSGGVVTWSLGGAGLANNTFFSNFFSGLTVNATTTLGFDPTPILRQAFAAWSAVANITFVQVADTGGNMGVGTSGDIRVVMANIDGSGSVVGKAYFPSSGGTANQSPGDGDIVLDSGETSYWTTTSFYLVALHEIGHALGMEHEPTANAVMNPTVNLSQFNTGPQGTSLQQDDIDGIRSVYGVQDFNVETYILSAGQTAITFLDTTALRVLGNAINNDIRGADGNETIIGGLGVDVLRGGNGNDALFGDFEPTGTSAIQFGSGAYAKPGNLGNGSIATAVNVSALFSLAASTNIADATQTPHVSITGAGNSSNSQTDFYAVTIANAGSILTLDVDQTSSGFDGYIRIRNQAGAVLFENDDSSTSDGAGGSTKTQDPFAVFVAPTAGTYFIEMGTYSSGASPIVPLASGVTYTLHISVSGEIDVGGGNDVMLGEGGDDLIRGGSGGDTLYGWLGLDTLFGDSGRDALYGEQDRDLLYGWLENDSLFGGDGNDTLWGEQDNDLLGGDNGDDLAYGGAGVDTLLGWFGNDTLWGGDGNDVAYGDDGFDALFGEAGNDTLFGLAQNDQLFGWLGADVLWGGDGDDLIRGEQDNDILLGETGNDLLLGDDGNDTAYGWVGNDSVYGWTGNDALFGEAGNDLILGEDGDDTLAGGRGNDTLTGGLGADRFYNANFEIAAGEIDRITAYEAADRYYFQTGASLSYRNFTGGAAIDVAVAGGGTFILDVLGANASQLQAQTLFF